MKRDIHVLEDMKVTVKEGEPYSNLQWNDTPQQAHIVDST